MNFHRWIGRRTLPHVGAAGVAGEAEAHRQQTIDGVPVLIVGQADGLPSIHARMEAGAVTDREPTEFGWFVMRRMADFDPPLNQSELARRARVSQSTIHRWIYSPGRPETDKLDRLSAALGVDHGELLAKAGYGRPADHVAERPIHRIARDIDAILSVNSPIPAEDRAALETVIDRMIDPYRKLLRRRRPA
jgi:transcriptional regulator with XRE-family HTH domain